MRNRVLACLTLFALVACASHAQTDTSTLVPRAFDESLQAKSIVLPTSIDPTGLVHHFLPGTRIYVQRYSVVRYVLTQNGTSMQYNVPITDVTAIKRTAQAVVIEFANGSSRTFPPNSTIDTASARMLRFVGPNQPVPPDLAGTAAGYTVQ